MNEPASSTLHATCLQIHGAGVLLLGASGSGKSDLALRLIDRSGASHQGSPEAVLVSDDRVVVRAKGTDLVARPPHAIRGRLEVRGVGIVRVPYVAETRVRVAVRLDHAGAQSRVPDFSRQLIEIAGLMIPELRIEAFEASAPAKIRAMVRAIVSEGFENHVVPSIGV